MPHRKHAGRRRGKKGRIDNKQTTKRRIIEFDIDDEEDCSSVHPDDGIACERKVGHDPTFHYYTVWGPEVIHDSLGEHEQWAPLFPIVWSDEDVRRNKGGS